MPKQIYGNKARQKLAKLLRMSEDSDRFGAMWECLEEDKIVDDWERGSTIDEDICHDARRVLRHFDIKEGRASSFGRKQEGWVLQDIPVEPAEREKAMTEALRTYFAAHAAQHRLVKRFRREYLPDGLLRQDSEISAFLSLHSPDLPPPEAGVEITVEGYLAYPEGKPADTVPLLLNSDPPQRDTCGVHTHEELARWRAQEEQRQEESMEWDWESYKWPPPGDLFETLGKWLLDKYPWASKEDAEVFLITGRPPRLAEPLRAAQDDANAAYSITFSPWISERSVLEAYRAIQSSYHRPPRDKTVQVLQFVSEQADDEGVLPSWATLHDWWNAAHPNPADKFSDRSALYKAYRRAVKTLVPPYLPLT
jgi:hypothetical protein